MTPEWARQEDHEPRVDSKKIARSSLKGSAVRHWASRKNGPPVSSNSVTRGTARSRSGRPMRGLASRRGPTGRGDAPALPAAKHERCQSRRELPSLFRANFRLDAWDAGRSDNRRVNFPQRGRRPIRPRDRNARGSGQSRRHGLKCPRDDLKKIAWSSLKGSAVWHWASRKNGPPVLGQEPGALRRILHEHGDPHLLGHKTFSPNQDMACLSTNRAAAVAATRPCWTTSAASR